MSAPSFDTGDLVLTEHALDVPLDHADPGGPTISVFAREVADPAGRDRPFLVFLQGGPGHEAFRPTRRPTHPSWLDRALQDFRVLMVDGRGTGRSSSMGSLSGLTPQQQADHLALFRADAIVADLELLRAHLGVDTWSVLGQSFGGFCTLRYLSAAPGGLRAAYLTGGVPPVGRPIDDVYAATYATMRGRNEAFFARYPEDRARLRALHDLADAGRLLLPHGEAVTSTRLRSVGNALGMSDGAERVHYLLELDPGSRMFRHDLAAALPFRARDPLYVLLQEACYADGGATRWAAERLMPDDFREDRTLFTGEHVFPATLRDDADLAPLADAADLLAEREWPRLYDEESLRSCTVPAAAAVYTHDAYVDATFSRETAALVPSLQIWETDAYEHNALRVAGGTVLDELFTRVAP